MSTQTEIFTFFLVLIFVTYCQGLQLSMGPPDDVYCGHLQCWADEDITDTSIFSIISLTVYDVTQSNVSIKLASLSLFHPDIYVEETKIYVINATGKISSKHAELTLSLLDIRYCRNSYFLCELDCVNASGQPHVIRETVSPGSSENFYEIELENVELRKQNVALKTDLDHALHKLYVLEALLNTTCDTTQNQTNVTCYRGMPHRNPREHFLLWGNVTALCDTETDGGGWIVIQRRTKGDVDFYRDWEDYKNGFGTPDTDFWIGNDIIHNLTSQGFSELRIDMEFQGKQYYAHYSSFKVDNETSNYHLSVSGNAGTTIYDSFSYNNDHLFSTYDRDNSFNGICTALHHGGWWYSYCTNTNLNGLWGAQDETGVYWHGLIEPGSVSFTEMKVRHV